MRRPKAVFSFRRPKLTTQRKVNTFEYKLNEKVIRLTEQTCIRRPLAVIITREN